MEVTDKYPLNKNKYNKYEYARVYNFNQPRSVVKIVPPTENSFTHTKVYCIFQYKFLCNIYYVNASKTNKLCIRIKEIGREEKVVLVH